MSYRGHGGSVGGGTISLWHLSLALMLKLLELIVHCVPARVLLKLIPLGLCQKLVETYHVVFVRVALLENMLPHPLHFLLPLPHIILRGVGIIGLVQLFLEQHTNLILIPLTVAI